MKKLFFLLGIIAISLSATRASGIEWSSLSVDKAIAKAKAENKLVFIDVFATWCGPCKYLDKKVFPDEALSEYFNAHFVNLELDGERGEGPGIMEKFSLSAFPSLIFLDGEGQLVRKQIGAMDAEGLLSLAKEVVDPKSSPLAKMEARFAEGERDRDFLFDYMSEMVDREQDPEKIARAYVESYPELDLEDEKQFLFFLFGVNELDHPAMKDYLGDIVKYEDLYPESSQFKIGNVLGSYGEKAVEAENPDLGIEALKTIYPALKDLLGKEVPKYKELESDYMEAYNDAVSE